jgi:hypothetical protein
MSFPEYQSPGVRTSRGKGEGFSYYVPFTQAQLVTMLPGLNVFNKLPAGTIIDIGGHLYRTLQDLDAGSPGPQIGVMEPMGPHRPTVIGPKDNSVFADRANVYWDAVNNCFTATVGTNIKVGYAISNPQIGSAVNPSGGSTLSLTNLAGAFPPSGQGTSLTGLTEYNAVATVTGGTSADGLPGAYAATDTSVEVELIGT